MTSTYPDTTGSNRTVGLLAALSAYTVLAVSALVLADLPTLVRIPVAVPVLLFAPGYALVAALFPRSRRLTSGRDYETSRSRGGTPDEFTTLERAVLAVVCSIALVPLVAVALNPVVGVDPPLVLVGVAVVTLFASLVGAVRAWTGPVAPSRGPTLRERLAFTVPTDTVTLVALALAAMLLVSSAAVALTGDGGDALETEFYFADGSPAPLETADTGGETLAYDLRISHHADHLQTYTVVVSRSTGDAGELTGAAVTVGPNETAAATVRVSRAAIDPGETLEFALYVGDGSTDSEGPHRVLRIGTNATAGP